MRYSSPTIVGLVSTDRIAAILDELLLKSRSTREQGALFERLVRQFLLTEPTYATLFDEVWLWNEWPGRGGATRSRH